MKFISFGLVLVSVFLLALAPDTGRAQTAGAPEQAAEAAAQLFDGGHYKEALDAYVDLVAKYPTSTVASLAQFRAGYLYYLLGDYANSLVYLKKTLAPPAPSDIQELGYSMVPQVLAAQASKLTDEAKRKSGFEEAIQQFDHFIQTFPQSAAIEGACYKRALAAYQIGKFDDAVTSLRGNLQRFPKSPSRFDSQYLLALTLATQANIASQADPASADAGSKYAEAEQLMRDIIKGPDVVLANDAQFQLGELLLNSGMLGSKDARNALLEKALVAYRAVQPREPMIAAQEARIAALKQRRIDALRAKDTAAVKGFDRLQENEITKLAAIKAKGDITVTAQIKIGEIYFRQDSYDNARVLLRQIQRFATDDEQKKEIQYYLTLTYSSQHLTDKAVEAYTAFKAAYKADPMGENLPLLIGSLFVTSNPATNNPEKAVEFFKEGVEMYPHGRLLDELLTQEAGALVQLNRLDAALKLYQDMLTGKPKREVAAATEFGMGTIYKAQGKIPDALAQYKKVRETYAGTPQAEQAAFWIGQLALQSKDFASASSESSAFLKNFPKSELCSTAKFNLAQATLSQGDKATALQLFKEISDEYPKSDASSFSYFRRAAILAGDKKPEEMVALMKEFIQRYPEDNKVFYAYDTIAQYQSNTGKALDAIATYGEMVEKHPADPQTSAALLDIVQLWRHCAEAQGRYLALNEQERADWSKAIASSIAAGEKLIADYPESKQLAGAMHEILEDQKLLVSSALKPAKDLTSYFQNLASKFEQKPQIKSKILFALASFTYETDKKAGIEQMNAAYNPQFLYADDDIDTYGAALLEDGKLEQAMAVYQKLAADFPIPAGVAPNAAPVSVQDAQAISLFGIGKAQQQLGKIAEAGASFDTLKKLYPWSPKVLEADFGIAEAKHQEAKEDEAVALLIQVIRAPTASADLRAKAMMLLGTIDEAKGDIPGAIDQYIKISVFYEAVPKTASEGLWKGGQLLERQAATLPETAAAKGSPTKSGQLKKAIEAYKDLVAKYPASERAKDADARLKALQPAR